MIPVSRETFESVIRDIQSKYEAEKDCLLKEIMTYKKVVKMMSEKVKLLQVSITMIMSCRMKCALETES